MEYDKLVLFYVSTTDHGCILYLDSWMQYIDISEPYPCQKTYIDKIVINNCSSCSQWIQKYLHRMTSDDYDSLKGKGIRHIIESRVCHGDSEFLITLIMRMIDKIYIVCEND